MFYITNSHTYIVIWATFYPCHVTHAYKCFPVINMIFIKFGIMSIPAKSLSTQRLTSFLIQLAYGACARRNRLCGETTAKRILVSTDLLLYMHICTNAYMLKCFVVGKWHSKPPTERFTLWVLSIHHLYVSLIWGILYTPIYSFLFY